MQDIKKASSRELFSEVLEWLCVAAAVFVY